MSCIPGSTTRPPGLHALLLPDGNLLRPMRLGSKAKARVGGPSGRLPDHRLNGKVLREFILNEPDRITTHGVTPMPNGNILCIGREFKTMADANQKRTRSQKSAKAGSVRTGCGQRSGILVALHH